MYTKHTLSNGLRVILAPMANTETVTALFLVGAGSKYETKSTSGISHFLEHLAFKGTKKRPKPKDITLEIDAVGGEMNAFTANEHTGYYVKVNFIRAELALDIVADITLNSLYPPAEIAKERGVIIEEINMYEDLPTQKVGMLWDEVLYGDQPAGWSVLGNKKTIKNMERRQIINYWRDQYNAKNGLLVLAGNLSRLKKPLLTAEKYFKNIGRGQARQKLPVKETLGRPRALIFTKTTDQTHLILGFKGGSLKDETVRRPLNILAALLGGYMSSRLFQEIREKRGLAYYVGCSTSFSTDTGCIAARAGVPNDKAEKAINLILKEFKKIKEGRFGAAEINRAKNNLIGQLSLNLESSDAIAAFLGEQEILRNKILTPEEIFSKIKAITAERLKSVAGEIFTAQRLNLALIGPFKGKEKFEKTLKI